MTKQTEALKLALEALETCGEDEWHSDDDYGMMQFYDEDKVNAAITAIKEALAQPAQEPVASVPIHPKTGPLWAMTTDKPDAERLPSYPLLPLYTSPPAQPPQPVQQEPVAIEYWLQETMESGRWVTTGNMSRATAEDYCEVYPEGRIVEPSPPQPEVLGHNGWGLPIEPPPAQPAPVQQERQKSGILGSPSDPDICNERSSQACGPVYCGDSGGYCNKCSKQQIIHAVKSCKGMNCGCTDGRSHSLECLAELAAAIAGGMFFPSVYTTPPQRKPPAA